MCPGRYVQHPKSSSPRNGRSHLPAPGFCTYKRDDACFSNVLALKILSGLMSLVQDWFEGCVHLNGAIVSDFVAFWESHWANAAERQFDPALARPEQSSNVSFEDVIYKFLPSPHHRNPNFRLPWQACAPPPQTPLNSELLRMLTAASKEIYIQTPNLTCPPVLDALVSALSRGVGVKILTSE